LFLFLFCTNPFLYAIPALFYPTIHQHVMTGYKSTPLYGGALICDLPEKFADVR
jgi:hypothetical protein